MVEHKFIVFYLEVSLDNYLQASKMSNPVEKFLYLNGNSSKSINY